ncbi:hybrid sensor histidine kinase/response regulator [Nostoc sp.]|uniref:hybrid sensor histidine kinase/response regulator n=1 Tax=Nostoc sp. TaxID=1180 RepID=UPI002FF57A1B
MMIALPGFQIVALLKAGVKAVIYRGIKVKDQCPVIIKGLRPEQCTPNNIEQLRHEYAIAQKLNIAAAVKAYALEMHQGIPYLIMEDFGGRSLDLLLDQFQQPVPFLKIAIEITSRLAEIHSHHIVHKDIKPQNILVNLETNQVKIADFGIAAFIPYEQQRVSSSSCIEGSLPYLSPEQTGQMNRGIDHRSDLYSLGVTFYEMLTGQLPFQGKDSLEWVHCHIAKSPPSPKKLNSDIPQMLCEIIIKLLSKVAEQRYQSALGLQFDLERCLEQLQTTTEIQSFVLGEQDISERFQIPQKLYGREQEIAKLLQAFERVVSQGKPEIVFVSGYAGVGKSSLVKEIHKPIVKERGVFICGKFDEYKRDIPYSTIVQAFQTLVRQILTEPEDKLATWKKRIQAALGNSGRLIADLIPELKLIIGEQSPIPELGSAESQNRFNLVFQNFISVFAQKEHPLTVLLDDMQWADTATLNLIQTIITGSSIQYLYFILAARSNEIDIGYPLNLMMDKVRQYGAKITEVILTPLNLIYVNQLIADTLHSSAERVEPLAKLILKKTDGNPFFVNEFLKTLYQENLLNFDRQHGVWQWNLAQIEAQGFTDNIVSLMIGRIQKLPPPTQQVLKLASCIGNRFDLEILALIGEQSIQETANALVEAILRELIIPIESDESTQKNYRFYHDRVQQAAYALIADESKSAVHLTIGRLLLKNASPEQVNEQIFDLVNQLNLAVNLISEQTEKDELVRLNLIAGKKAKASTGYTLAKRFFNVAMNLLAENAWIQQYEQTFTLFKEQAECEFLTGNLEQAEELFETLLLKAESHVEKANIYMLQIRLYQVAGRYEEALTLGLEALKLFGVTFPDPNEQVQAAITIDNARYQEAQQAQTTAEQALERIARLQSITSALSESLTPAQVSEVIVEQSMAALGASSALVALLNENKTELEIVRAVGYNQDLLDTWRHFAIDSLFPLAEAVRTGQPIWAQSRQNQIACYPDLAEIYAQYDIDAWISIPLMVEGWAVGGITLGFAQPQLLSGEDQAFILAVAQQCAQAIARAHLYEAERTARNAAESANRIKDEFLAVLSHELRTPLNPILGWTKLMRTRKLDQVTSDRALETIERNAKLQTQLIEDLLDVSRILQGKLNLNFYAINLVSVIEAAIETVRLSAQAKSIEIQTILESGVGQVLGDANRLQQVIWNILSNAIKFTPTGGQVKIKLEQVGLQVQICITDTGKGIVPEFLAYVFDYFRQADSATTRKFGGLGLGLAIVRHLVELHGGTVQAESLGEGQGATFTIRLPCLQDESKGIKDAKDNSSLLADQSSPLSGLQILVVDDDADMREFLSFMLEQYGATVITVTSAIEALTALSQSQPNLIISDIGMPEMDGYMLMRQVRSLKPEQGGGILAIALTAYAGEMDQQQAIAVGFQQHISKPVDPEELVKAIVLLGTDKK